MVQNFLRAEDEVTKASRIIMLVPVTVQPLPLVSTGEWFLQGTPLSTSSSWRWGERQSWCWFPEEAKGLFVLWRPQSIKVRLCLMQKGQRGFLAHFRLNFMTYVPKQHSEGTLIFHLVALPTVPRALALRHGSDWHWGTHIFPSFHSGFPPRLALSALLCPLPLGRPSPS